MRWIFLAGLLAIAIAAAKWSTWQEPEEQAKLTAMLEAAERKAKEAEQRYLEAMKRRQEAANDAATTEALVLRRHRQGPRDGRGIHPP